MSKHQRLAKAVSPVIETLERRRLLASSIVLNTLTGPTLASSGTSGVQQNPDVAVGNEIAVMVWADSNASGGSGIDVVGRRFDSEGEFAGGAFRVNTTTTGDQDSAAVAAADDGSFVVVWTDQSVNPSRIRAQRFSSSASAAGSEFTVNTDTTNSKGNPAIGMSGDGRFIVVWQSAGQDGDGTGIYGQRYSSDGTPSGGEFLVNSTTSGDQFDAAVAMDDSANFAATWVSTDTDGEGVFRRLFNSAGTAQQSDTLVNTTESDDQRQPDIAMAGNGKFVIAWSSDAQDGSGQGVYFQRFDSSSAAQGSETLVNQTTDGNQRLGSVAINDGGSFTVAFQDQSTDPFSIRARKFASDGSATTSESLVGTSTATSARPNIARISDLRLALATNSNEGGNDDVFATLVTSQLEVRADAAGSSVVISESSGDVVVSVDGSPETFSPSFESLRVIGGAGNDVISIGDDLPSAIKTISADGGGGDDEISGSNASERLDGGEGKDTIDGGDGEDTIDGGDGDDSLRGGDGDDNLSGDDGNDSIEGNDGTDTVRGDADDDTLNGGEGTDTIDGGSGTDYVVYYNRQEDLTIT
ncbi:MAG: calcium-binding protein, partial [Tepidisphaeraceae bacterium]